MKLFKTNNIDVVKSCQLHFVFSLSSKNYSTDLNRNRWKRGTWATEKNYLILVIIW